MLSPKLPVYYTNSEKLDEGTNFANCFLLYNFVWLGLFGMVCVVK